MKLFYCLCALVLLRVHTSAAPFKLTSFSADGRLSWTNSFAPGICTIERADRPKGPWAPVKNLFSTGGAGSFSLPPAPGFYRVFTADVAPTPEGFQNFAGSWSTLSTIAGRGYYRQNGFNGWEPRFEGGLATDAELSRPHYAMADGQGNIFIADKDAHAIRRVTREGRIFTAAGTGQPGDDGDSAGPATGRRLTSPNGLWVRADGVLYILDLGNKKIRKVDAAGQMTTLFKTGSTTPDRGLWVSADETLAYFSGTTELMKWTKSKGVQRIASGFTDLANLAVDPSGQLFVTDRGASTVYRVDPDGTVVRVAGDGTSFSGGDGSPALETGWAGVRGIWFVPTGGYLLATHEGSQVWYVDTAGIIHLMVNGAGNSHSGDGEDYRTPGFKVSEVRSVTLDGEGNIIITESDFGFIRKIDFLRRQP